VLTILLLAGLGLLLPARQGATLSRSFQTTPEVVWQFLTDLDSQPTWRRNLSRVERLPDQGGRPAWLEYSGGRAEAVRMTEVLPYRRLVTEEVAPEEGRPGGSWTWDLKPAEGGSRVTLTREVLVDAPLARALGFIFQAPRREAERSLSDLAQRVERAERLRAAAVMR
jgi:uncharacterized protein YndB with AHSA1/START domain